MLVVVVVVVLLLLLLLLLLERPKRAFRPMNDTLARLFCALLKTLSPLVPLVASPVTDMEMP